MAAGAIGLVPPAAGAIGAAGALAYLWHTNTHKGCSSSHPTHLATHAAHDTTHPPSQPRSCPTYVAYNGVGGGASVGERVCVSLSCLVPMACTATCMPPHHSTTVTLTVTPPMHCPCCQYEAALCGDGGGCCAPSVVAPQTPSVPPRPFCKPPGGADHDAPAQAGVTATTRRHNRQLHTSPCAA